MDEFDYLLTLVLIMLFATAIMDTASMFMVKNGSVDIEDYATAVLKWPKVILLGVFGIVLLYYAFTTQATAIKLVAEIVIGILMLVDCTISSIVKVRYGKKK